jgi:hypothetical protein
MLQREQYEIKKHTVIYHTLFQQIILIKAITLEPHLAEEPIEFDALTAVIMKSSIF